MTELIAKGIKMPEGTVVKLPPPLLRDGMDAAAQQAAMHEILPPNCAFDEFTSREFARPRHA